MPLAKETTGLSRFITFASFVLVVTVLRVAQDVMIPVALSLLLAFLLSPLVVRLTRWKVPKTLAIILTASLAFVVIGLTAWQITTQAMSLLNELPKYEDNVTAKIAALKKPDSTGSLSRALTTLERFWLSVQAPDPTTSAPVTPDGTKPVPVEVKPSHATGIDFVREVAGRLFEPLGVAGIVIVLVIATLFQREDLRSRFIRVVSGGQINIATEAVDDASRRVSRYLFAQLMVNTFFGVAVGLGLFFIGVPHAGLWGLLSTLLRFIPFLGPLIAVVFPLALSIAVDPGWTMLFWTAGLFIVAELLTNNVIEVLVYGTSTGISTLALLAAAVFWSWLWGLPGLFLSTPMTVCLLVLGQYVPGLRFLGVLLGSEPPLEPSAQFYQTMLSMDQEDLFAQAEAHVQQRTLAGFYDDVFVPALLMSEVDRHKGLLAEVRQRFIFDAGQELIEELSERERAVPLSPPGSAPLPPRFRDQVLIGVPARDEADELVGLMLAHLLRESGLRAKVSGVTASADSYARELKSEDATVFVSGLPPATLSAAGRACRRVKEMNPAAKVIVGIWAADQQTKNLHHRLEQAGADRIVTRLADAVEQLKAMLIVAPAPNAPQPETQTTRVLEQTERVVASARPEEATDAVVKELARALDVPVSLVTIVESDQVFWKEVGIVASDLRAGEKTVFDEAIATDHFQAVGEMAKDERFAQHPLLAKRGVQAFASAPLRTRAGHRVGNLCVLDTKPRAFSEADKELLQSLAVQLMEAIDGKPTVDEGAAVNEAAPYGAIGDRV